MSLDPRNYRGYGPNPPHPRWPGNARVAVQVVLNYEEGGENCVLNGDPAAETFLSEIINAPRVEGRHISMESIYEYGTRAGVWRLLALFRKYQIPVTIFAVALALEKYPEMAKAFLQDGHEIASHGYRWINYQDVDEATEREHMQRAIEIIRNLTGEAPQGWYTGRTSPNTRRLVKEQGTFLYDADDYSDDLPFWDENQLIIPYTLDSNDMRFASPQGFNSGEQFYTYLKDAFDTLYEEGKTAPKMLSVGLHCRIVGRPGRIASLERFFQYITSFPDVWICRRLDIARHWHQRKEFVEKHAAIYEHSPWVAEAAFGSSDIAAAMRKAVDEAGSEKQLELIRLHPDLGVKLDTLTASSISEQQGAGLNQCSPEEYASFQKLNQEYKEKFGFPFIVAVKGLSRQDILGLFQERIHNDPDKERATALEQIHRIAHFRLEALR